MAAIEESADIPRFYAGRAVFITGATGFVGKVLVERLLATCPDIGRLYLLMRTKRDSNPEERLKELKASQVFDVIRQSDPKQLEKLCPVPGDISLPALGISEELVLDLQEVSVVFHSAATVKFDEAMPRAVQHNVLSVIKLLELCDKLPNVQAFVHVSTAYSNAEHSTIEERVYPPTMSLEALLKLVSEDSPELEDAKRFFRFISPKPNTYTFTKAMAEVAIQEHENRRYPVAIFRPTIVISSLRHPFPGWIDSLTGLSGVIAGMARGVLHVFRCQANLKPDLAPVDLVVDTLIAVAWETAVDNSPTPRVYNCSIGENPVTWWRIQQELNKNAQSDPTRQMLWYPFIHPVKNSFIYKALELLLQTIPLHLAEYITQMLGIQKRPGVAQLIVTLPSEPSVIKRPRFITSCNKFSTRKNVQSSTSRLNLITISQRLSSMNDVLHYFSLREWNFKSDNVRKLRERLHPEDRKLYNLDPNSICWEHQFRDFYKGVQKYLLKEKEQDLPAAKRRLNQVYFLHCGVSVFLPVILFRALIKKKHRHDILKLASFLFSIFKDLYLRLLEKVTYVCQITKINETLDLSMNKIVSLS